MKALTREERIQLEEDCCFQPRYSGEDSRKFWSELGKAKNSALYSFGCALQSMEQLLLLELNESVVANVRAALRKKPAKKPRRLARRTGNVRRTKNDPAR